MNPKMPFSEFAFSFFIYPKTAVMNENLCHEFYTMMPPMPRRIERFAFLNPASRFDRHRSNAGSYLKKTYTKDKSNKYFLYCCTVEWKKREGR